MKNPVSLVGVRPRPKLILGGTGILSVIALWNKHLAYLPILEKSYNLVTT